MSENQYTYAVARIRAKEASLLSQGTIEQLLACQTQEQCIQLLAEKGWGDMESSGDPAAMLNREHEKTWELMRELVKDMSVFDVLSYPDLYHNLKAAIKEAATEEYNPNIFFNDCSIDGQEMLDIIKNKEYQRLPVHMQQVAKDAFETLLHTRDGQLCDIMVDQAALAAIYQAGKASKDEILRVYAESTVAVANIKIAVRSQKTAKSLEFMKKAMAECDTLNIQLLAQAALAGDQAVKEYLEGTDYAEGAQALEESPSAFERWCDNRIIKAIRPQIYNPFSVGPLVAYVLARENEIKTVRIILSGKANGLPEESIRERVREMYV